jgi:hypothetical protein
MRWWHAKKMKASAAFAVGLWTGAVVVAAVGWFHFLDSQRSSGGASTETAGELAAKTEEIRLLRHEQARLIAERQRLRETVSELKSNRVARAVFKTRRNPRDDPASASAHTARPPEQWMEEAVAEADEEALPRLEELAMQSDTNALEALALMAESGGAAALTRVWNSHQLDAAASRKAARFLGATLEVNQQGQVFLLSVPALAASDPRLLDAAVDGVANPNFPVSLGQHVAVPAPPQFKPDFALRLRVLENWRGAIADVKARAYIDAAREVLQSRWAQTQAGATGQ